MMGNGCDGGREVSEVTVWLPDEGDDCNAEAASHQQVADAAKPGS
ncbi:hypothetical protein CASFOL_034250 [Castilleja foliolosa]|uniref:Uncharacterized protein n=1 Tax=Castilleja foliolosa TaxID=1961234 RepID=A0ABD3BXV4_9LAMI